MCRKHLGKCPVTLVPRSLLQALPKLLCCWPEAADQREAKGEPHHCFSGEQIFFSSQLPQHHRMPGVGREPWSSSGLTPAPAGPPAAGCPGPELPRVRPSPPLRGLLEMSDWAGPTTDPQRFSPSSLATGGSQSPWCTVLGLSPNPSRLTLPREGSSQQRSLPGPVRHPKMIFFFKYPAILIIEESFTAPSGLVTKAPRCRQALTLLSTASIQRAAKPGAAQCTGSGPSGIGPGAPWLL